MLRTHLLSLVVAAVLVMVGACTSPKPIETAEKRPSADEVAQEASEEAAEAEVDELVLYSSSMEKAELETGAEGHEGARAGEGVEDEAIPEPVELRVSADKNYVLAEETFSEIPALLDALERVRAERPAESVLILADADASDEAIVDAITAARRAGFTSMEIEVGDEDLPAEAPAEDATDTEPPTP